MAKAFCRLILWASKKKESAVFYGTAFRKRSFGSFFIGKGNGKAGGMEKRGEKKPLPENSGGAYCYHMGKAPLRYAGSGISCLGP